MSTTTNGEGYEGFVSSSKGITLSIVSLGVWGFTLIFYKMAVAVVSDIDYKNFCLFCSFFLSLVLGIMISRTIYRRTDKLRVVAIMLNILLIYTSANGIQAGNASFPSNDAENGERENGALFGFLDSRPWLQDAKSKTRIKNLQTINTRVQSDLQVAIKNAEDYKAEVQKLKRENTLLLERVNLMQSPGGPNMDDLYSRINRQQEIMEGLKSKANDFNRLRGQWVNKIRTDREFSQFAESINRRLVSFQFPENYLNQVFSFNLTPQ